MYIDSHCHITCTDNIEELVNKIKASGIYRIIVNGCDMESNLLVLDLVKKYDIVYGAIGFHPTELNNFNDSYFNWLCDHVNDEKIVAIGEIGLDYHYDDTDKSKQIKIFKKQLDIANKYNKSVIIHTRDSIKDTYDLLKMYNLKGSIHCFSGSLEMAHKFIKLGYYLGIGGVCTYKNAKNIVNVINNINLSYILLETDSPYLSPEPYRGKINSSCNIPIIAEKIAAIKGITVDEVKKITYENANRCFFDNI